MSRSYALLTCLFFVASAIPAQSAPQDSPGTIYIDGVACNLACQAYLAWSRQVLSQQTTAAAPAKPRRPARVAQPAVQPKPQRVAKLPAPRPIDLAPSRSAVENAPARAEPAPPPVGSDPQPVQPDAKVSPNDIPAAPASNAPDAAAAAPEPRPATPEPQPPAATATEAPAPSPSNSPAGSDTAALAPNDTGGEMVAILLVRSEIKSASDLTNKIIAVDDSATEYSVADLRKAIVAAGATEVELINDKKAALVRVIDGEVPAAVVSVMSSKSTEVWNAGLSGLNVLRIPLPSATATPKRG